ncbi:MAG TPA: hypothetical protein PKC43_01975 [Phycisphaerales bacterium]|nr:hypothetical protein [Phycisphaerales bacterium]HMP36193.1 hypothetical protein [Phycisphaerales bacterium]
MTPISTSNHVVTLPATRRSNGALRTSPQRILVALAAICIAAAPLVLGGCERGHDHAHGDHDHDHHGAGSSEGGSGTSRGHGHDHHDDHDHSHGPMSALGTTSVGPFVVRVARGGELAPGAEIVVDLWIEESPGDVVPAAVRAWIGTEDAAGAIRVRLNREGDGPGAAWHEHLEAPATLAESPLIWIEIETPGGERHRGSIAAKEQA